MEHTENIFKVLSAKQTYVACVHFKSFIKIIIICSVQKYITYTSDSQTGKLRQTGTLGVDFTNLFTRSFADPKSIKIQLHCQYLFALLGSE